MIAAAISARKSTEQNGTADEARSVARQVEHAKAYAARKGWTVADEHIYVDDGVSGAEFARRPGFELEREKAGQRTYDAMVRNARAGHVTGGRVFGYTNVRNGDGSVHRVIHETEATVVRRIFEMYAGGLGLRRIAHTLRGSCTMYIFTKASRSALASVGASAATVP